jgi:hypothetical protein
MVKRKRNTAICTIREAAMHPTIGYELNRARTAELRDQAQRDGLAYTARRARRPRRHQVSDHLPTARLMAVRRLLTMPGTRTD